MRIKYDHNLRIAGIGLAPWTRLGLERWLKAYKIASLYGWDMKPYAGLPEIHALTEQYDVHLERQNTQRLLEDSHFQRLLQDEFLGYSFITYKAVPIPSALDSHRFLTINTDVASRLENKAEFRRLMAAEQIPFPAYRILAYAELLQESFATLSAGREKIVLQDDVLSGGKGTFIVFDQVSFCEAVEALKKYSKGASVVVSDYIEGARERSVQCVVTRHGIFVGPLQKQIIDDPLLSNRAAIAGDKFCGAEIGADDQWAGIYPEVKKYAERIGELIQNLGYRGIFGLDCLVGPDGKLYILEVNPRITGVTPLLTMMYRPEEDIPFYLLHVLELANADYDIIDRQVNPKPAVGGLMMLHSQELMEVRIAGSVTSGLYDSRDLKLLHSATHFSPDETEARLLVQQYTPVGVRVKPGGRLLTAFTNTPLLDSNDKLLEATQQTVRDLLGSIELSP